MGAGRLIAAFVGAFILVGLITLLTSFDGHGTPYGGPIPVGTTGSQVTLPSSDAYRSSFSWPLLALDVALTAAALLLIARVVAGVASAGTVAATAGGAVGLVVLFTVLGCFPRASDIVSALLPATGLAGLTTWLYAVIVGSIVALARRRKQSG